MRCLEVLPKDICKATVHTSSVKLSERHGGWSNSKGAFVVYARVFGAKTEPTAVVGQRKRRRRQQHYQRKGVEQNIVNEYRPRPQRKRYVVVIAIYNHE